ncbi:thiamine biosynthesis protein [Acetobacter orientalis]|uniref:Thiamine biosynthesis protein n=1 Tax=Acetobacter orientalis TaxID=146474 RepID=A0A252A4Q9_9PROT|nr:sulfur carrier protein ThiS [Acetobacter orientalis]MDN6041362.1 sulfur carrier protein ThiS [Acetobacter sp.]MCP1222112.1 sulfur carrier protein ThiS [Acetobacter orientalis]OUI84418.1 thiamine biosynthesis protein [Acetobacter orientalis]OUJ17799.1 thiamine biosynthesis protein [Acetobacter orientalis]BBC78512.1 thiamine biosynthesis protein ThiS [Acetobacter orientalis]
MKIVVNEQEHNVSATTLAALIDELGYGGARVATALNGDFVPVTHRKDALLKDGVKIEIVAPMQGG